MPPPAFQDMIPLWNLHKHVKFMANLYVGETLDILYQTFRSDNQSDIQTDRFTLQDLSLIERSRVFRAIYRFIIHGNLFSPNTFDPCEVEQQAEYFLCRFSNWQVEELSCFNDFMVNGITRKWLEMEDNAFKRLVADPELDLIPRSSNSWHHRWAGDFFSRDYRDEYFAHQRKLLSTLSIKTWELYSS